MDIITTVQIKICLLYTSIGEAEITIVDKLPYQIVVDSWDLAGGTYDATGKTITWTETIKDVYKRQII